MSVKQVGLQNNVVYSYDQTKTTLQGRGMGQRSVTDGNGTKTVIGAQPIINSDIFDDTGVAPTSISCATANGRLFIGKGFASNVLTISYYLLTTTNGVTTSVWQGDLKFTLGVAAVTYANKGMQVDDSTPSSMVFMFSDTHTTLVNGGLFSCHGVNVTDFVKVSVPTFPVATLASQTKVVYMHGDAALQASTTLTVSDGVGYDPTAKKAYVLNGLAATPSIYVFDMSVPSASVPGANGYTNTQFLLKTGSLAALTGTILLVNNVQVFTPVAQPAPNNTNNGSVCLGFLTSTNIYWAKVSDITAAVTTLPSLLTCGLSISSDFTTAASISMGQYVASIDKWILLTAQGETLLKQGINNDTNGKIFGFQNYIKTEVGGMIGIYQFGGGVPICLIDCNGFATMINSAVGQRSALLIDLQSDGSNKNPSTGEIITSIIFPVLNVNVAKGIFLALYKEFAQRSVYPTVQYRTSSFSTGPSVGFDATWTTAPRDGDLSLLANVSQVQFRIVPASLAIETNNGSQINEAYLIYTDYQEITSGWTWDNEHTTTSGNSPMKVSVRQTVALTSTPTKFQLQGRDDSGNIVSTIDTVSNPTQVQLSNNTGTSYSAWVSMANFISSFNTALTTEILFTVTSVPVTANITWSFTVV